MPNPQVPNYVPGVGQLVTYRVDFESHILGTGFRQDATTIDLNPIFVIGSNTPTNVQEALEALAGILAPTVPEATSGSSISNLGIITLGGDLAGLGTTALSPKVSGIQGRPISSAAPTTGQVLAWTGSAWAPGSSSSSFTAGGDLTGNATLQYVTSLSGSNGGGGAVTLSSAAFINASGNETIISIAGNPILLSDASTTTILQSVSGKVLINSATSSTTVNGATVLNLEHNSNIVAKFAESSTDYISLGDSLGGTSTVGLIRSSNTGSGRSIIGINQIGYGSYSVLSVDNSGDVILNAPSNESILTQINGATSFQIAGSGIAIGPGTPSFGNGLDVAYFQNTTLAPTVSPSNGALLYGNDGYLWVYQSNGLNFPITQNGGTAGGDLTGTYPDPTIAKLQGKTVSASSPSNGQVLEYNGSAWVAANPAAGGDLTGTYPNPTIAKLQGVTVTASSPSTGQVLEYNGSAWVPTTISASGARAYFGTGADGVLVFDGTSTVLGLVPTSSKYTMTRNINATNLTVNVGVTIETVGNGIFCNGTLTNNGTIDDSGSAGSSSGAAGGGASSTVFFGGGSNGGISGPATAGQSFSSNAAGYGGAGGSAGAAGGALNGGGYTLIDFPPLCLLTGSVIISQSVSSSTPGTMWGGSGGGGGVVGGSSGVIAGGGGGGGGGFMPITCATLTGNGLFRAVGGNGGPGTANSFPSGGGGGGGGGVIIIAYGSKSTWVGTTNVNGGSGGTGGASGGANGNPGGIGGVVMFQG